MLLGASNQAEVGVEVALVGFDLELFDLTDLDRPAGRRRFVKRKADRLVAIALAAVGLRGAFSTDSVEELVKLLRHAVGDAVGKETLLLLPREGVEILLPQLRQSARARPGSEP